MPVGRITNYDLTVGLYLDIEPVIALLDPFDNPLQTGMGADGRSVLASGSCFEKKIEWLDETLLLPRSALTTNTTAAGATITVGASDQLKFSTGDVLLIDNEYVRVTGYSSTDSLAVTRDYGATGAAVHATAAVILSIGTALPEGNDPENARAIDRTNRFNYTEIFGPTAVLVSESENVVRKYGVEGEGEFQHQLANRTKEHFVAREQALVYGVRLDDTTNKWRTLGGIDYFITTNRNTTVTQLTETTLLDALQTSYNAGGSGDYRLLLGAKRKRQVSGLSSNLVLQETLSQTSRGQVVDYFASDFGRVTMCLDRWVRDSDAFLFVRDQASIENFRPFAYVPLAKTGDSMKGQVVSEISFRFRKERHAFSFKGLT